METEEYLTVWHSKGDGSGGKVGLWVAAREQRPSWWEHRVSYWAQKAERKGEVRLTGISNNKDLKGVWTSLAIRDRCTRWLVEFQHKIDAFEDVSVRNAFGWTSRSGLNTSGGFFYSTRHQEVAGAGVGLAIRWCQSYFCKSLGLSLMVAK